MKRRCECGKGLIARGRGIEGKTYEGWKGWWEREGHFNQWG